MSPSFISAQSMSTPQKFRNHPIYKMTKADNLADVYFVKLHKEDTGNQNPLINSIL